MLTAVGSARDWHPLSTASPNRLIPAIIDTRIVGFSRVHPASIIGDPVQRHKRLWPDVWKCLRYPGCEGHKNIPEKSSVFSVVLLRLMAACVRGKSPGNVWLIIGSLGDPWVAPIETPWFIRFNKNECPCVCHASLPHDFSTINAQFTSRRYNMSKLCSL